MMEEKLLPCPFCNAAMAIKTNRDWHKLYGHHSVNCIFDEPEVGFWPATDENYKLIYKIWNTRATKTEQGESEKL